jgi:hypothetical protein
MKQTLKIYAALAAAFVLLAGVIAPLFSGCNPTTSTGPLPASTPVKMSALFTKSGGGGIFKMTAGATFDSLRIDSAVVVFSRIRFLQHADTVTVDSEDSHHGGDGMTVSSDDSSASGSNLTLRGPFVVHIHDTVAIDFANQSIPPGTYDGIKFKIHRLEAGESHEDADEHHRKMASDDSSLSGSSIVVWGAVLKSGSWQSFTFELNDELEFKVKGNFIVPAQTSVLSVALNVDMASWFRNPMDGTLLDPTDSSSPNLALIRQAIAKAFHASRGGHDGGDGHVDD